jgi:hypothetical protein
MWCDTAVWQASTSISGESAFSTLEQRTMMEATCSSEALALPLNCTTTLYLRLSQSVHSSLWELQISGKDMLSLWTLTLSVTNSKIIFGIKVKVQLSLCLSAPHTEPIWWSEGMVPHILNFSNRMWVGKDTPVAPHQCRTVLLQNKLLAVHPHPCIEA